MSVTKLFPSGAWQVSEVIGARWICRTYYGYTKREAVAEFKAEVSQLA